jgi:hypothetical protein
VATIADPTAIADSTTGIATTNRRGSYGDRVTKNQALLTEATRITSPTKARITVPSPLARLRRVRDATRVALVIEAPA